jgi:ornithine cyclodeaminase
VLLETGWVTPGTCVIPYGTVSAVDLDLVDVMDKVVVDDWGQATVGPLGALRRHVDTGRLSPRSLHAELGEIVAGRKPGREHPGERTLFWHRGLATTDLAVAKLLLDRAAAAGLGTLLRYR